MLLAKIPTPALSRNSSRSRGAARSFFSRVTILDLAEVYGFAHRGQVSLPTSPARSPLTVYWTAFVGLFFDYYDLYLFVYLEKVLAGAFQLTGSQSNALQFSGVAGVGLGALGFG